MKDEELKLKQTQLHETLKKLGIEHNLTSFKPSASEIAVIERVIAHFELKLKENVVVSSIPGLVSVHPKNDMV